MSEQKVDPGHYKRGPVETIEILESIIGDQARQLTPEERFRVAQAVRYLLRCGCKGGREMAKMDMAKALNYTYRALTGSWLPKEFMDRLPVRK